ncbi:fungal-specific transcription factor domain-containing protein [Xylariales sp. AK1849]|nr:fungal-specific transcription factor domain-containing protein [Xylariales sp. AK1849]
MRPPMRSSIACLRCRKSKIKCENNGGTSPCDSCLKTGKDCVFKLPEANPTPPKRNEPPSAIKQERDGGSDRKKLKKIDDIARMDNEKATLFADEVLSAPFLTEDIWDQVLDLYKLHFAPELPFLHLPNMKEKLGRKFRNSQPDASPDFNLVLLGVLTLTARYHTDLVKYLAHICNAQGGNARSRPVQTQIDPAAASEYYAETLTRALGSMRTAMGSASVERVQALLMLGLYEWGQTRPNTGGLGAWMFVGTAIRMAQFLKLGFLDKGLKGTRGQPIDHRSRASLSQSQVTLEQEIKRRTMFSCFILDRMLACGKERLSIMYTPDLVIQLPCSEDKFDLGMEACTGFLDQDEFKDPQPTDDSVLSRFIRLIKLWGEISKYSVAGGRLTEQLPPWNDRSKFFDLNSRLIEFEEELPETFKFSRSNYFRHENHQASSVYVLLHMLRNVSLIMLHREYIPFVPIRCKEPEGPLDRPTFPKEEAYRAYWLDSAEQVFKAAREIVDLIEICQKKDKLPQSTIVLFAIWTAAFVGLYAIHFPQMDVKKHILTHNWNEPREETDMDIFKSGPTGLAFTTLSKMSVCLSMASTYVTVLQKMDSYFIRIKRDYERHAEKNKALSEKINLSLRNGGKGGGLEEYQPLTIPLKEFGSFHPSDKAYWDNMERSRASTLERSSPVGADALGPSAADRGQTPRSTPSVSFTAINHAPTSAGHQDPNGLAGPRLEPMTGISQEAHADGWHRQPITLPQIQSPAQAQAFATSAVAMLDPAATAAQAVGYSTSPDYLQDEERRRFSNTNDLGILTQNDDPWIDGQPFPFFDLPHDNFAVPQQYGSYA